MVTLGFTVLFAIVVAFSAIVGLIRGLNKSVIRLITLVLAVALTFLIAGPVTKAVVQNITIEGQTLGELALSALSDVDMIGGFLESAPLLQGVILVLPAFVLSIVVFPVVFGLLRFVTWLIFVFTQKPLRKLIFKDNCNKAEAAAAPTGIRVAKRFGGMGVGIVCGVLIFGMLLAPVFGLFSILPTAEEIGGTLDTMAEQNILTQGDVQTAAQAYAVTDSGVVKFYDLVGVSAAGRAYINSVSKIEADGRTVYLADELGSLLKLVQTVAGNGTLQVLSAAEDPAQLYALLADREYMNTLMQDLFGSQLLCSAVPDLMAFAVESVASTMNVPANKEAVYNNMMDDVASAVQNAEIDYAGIHAYEKANGIQSKFALLSAKKTSDEQVMTQEEYEAQVQKLVELAQTISKILNSAIAGDNAAFTDSIADHIVNEIKTQAAAGGQDVIENFDASGVQSAIATADPADLQAGEGDAAELLQQLTDAQQFETDVATVETIAEAIRTSVQEALADESAAAETATTLANVVSDLAGAVASAVDEEGNLDITKLNFEQVASAVTELQNSSLKEVGSSVLDIVASGDLGDSSLVSDMIGAVKEGYEKGEDIGGTIGTAGALINMGSAMSGEGDNQEAMVNSLTSLINNLNDYTISLLPTIMSADTITSMGVPAEYADASYTVIETLLKELMNLEGEENYENEVNAILSLYNLATSGVTEFDGEDVKELVAYGLNSDAIYNTLMSVSSSNPFGMTIEDEEQKEVLINSIEAHYNDSGRTEREREIYTAVARLLGLEEEVELN